MQPQSSKSTGQTCQSTTMCGRSRRKVTGALTSSAAASRAKTSASPEKVQDSQERGPVFGTILLGSFAQFGPDGWSSKTCQLSLLEGSEPFSETWPKSGMTRNGTAYRLAPLVLRTGGNASGSWPTPSASGMPCEGTVRLARKAWLDGTATLEEANAIAGRDVRDAQGKVPAMWPTPRGSDTRDGQTLNEDGRRVSRSGVYGANLADAVKFWPTPNASQISNNTSVRCSGDGRAKPNKLGWAVAESNLNQPGGQLNPTWVEWLMGFPLEWTALDASETPWCRKSLKSSGGQSLKRKRE